MSFKNMGVPITLDIERNLIFNLNVLEKCVEKFGSIDEMLNKPLNELATAKWLAVEMLNEDAEIWNEEHPNDKKPLIDEKKLGRYLIGIQAIRELSTKVQEAMLKGLPEEQVQEIEEVGKNLIAAQSLKNKELRKKSK